MRDRAMSVADIVEAAARGKMGHSEAIRRLGLGSYGDLVETMRLNGRSLWAHRHTSNAVDDETLTVLALACALRPGPVKAD